MTENPLSRGRGRPKGSKNKVQAETKSMILQSVYNRGGQEYIDALDDDHFVPLLKAITPKPVEVHHEGDITINVRTGVTKPGAK